MYGKSQETQLGRKCTPLGYSVLITEKTCSVPQSGSLDADP
jgi:hypothetical protein